MSLISILDSTLLKPLTRWNDILELAENCEEYNFRGICIPPYFVKKTRNFFPKLFISTVIGFPLGYNHCVTKINEAKKAIDDGVDELDVVWNQGRFQDKEYLFVVEELSLIVKLGKTVKVIVEEGFLDKEHKQLAYHIVEDSGAYAIKTGTGFNKPADIDTVRLWRSMGPLSIKAAGGIKNYFIANAFVQAGANIIGTSSAKEIYYDWFVRGYK